MRILGILCVFVRIDCVYLFVLVRIRAYSCVSICVFVRIRCVFVGIYLRIRAYVRIRCGICAYSLHLRIRCVFVAYSLRIVRIC